MDKNSAKLSPFLATIDGIHISQSKRRIHSALFEKSVAGNAKQLVWQTSQLRESFEMQKMWKANENNFWRLLFRQKLVSQCCDSS